MGADFRRDQVDVDAGELYDYSKKTGVLPEISAVSPEDYRRCFEKYTKAGFEVLHVSLSSQLSECYHNACQAAEQLEGVYVVDSQSVSTGTGQLAMLAAELASADYLAAEIRDALNEMKQKLDVSFVLQDSDYLHRQGKSGGLAARSARLLKLKPEIILEKGSIHHGKPFRGDMESSILEYVKSRLSGRRNIQTDRIFVTYSGVPQASIDKVTALLRQLQPFEQILEIPAASVVSCRCGPGRLGLAFMTT